MDYVEGFTVFFIDLRARSMQVWACAATRAPGFEENGGIVLRKGLKMDLADFFNGSLGENHLALPGPVFVGGKYFAQSSAGFTSILSHGGREAFVNGLAGFSRGDGKGKGLRPVALKGVLLPSGSTIRIVPGGSGSNCMVANAAMAGAKFLAENSVNVVFSEGQSDYIRVYEAFCPKGGVYPDALIRAMPKEHRSDIINPENVIRATYLQKVGGFKNLVDLPSALRGTWESRAYSFAELDSAKESIFSKDEESFKALLDGIAVEVEAELATASAVVKENKEEEEGC